MHEYCEHLVLKSSCLICTIPTASTSPIHLFGWECPRCQAVMAPYMSTCVYCTPKTFPGTGVGGVGVLCCRGGTTKVPKDDFGNTPCCVCYASDSKLKDCKCNCHENGGEKRNG